MKPTGTVYFQIIWGVLLILVGGGVIFKISQDMPTLASDSTFVRLCFYLISIILIGGGIRKLYINIGEINKEE